MKQMRIIVAILLVPALLVPCLADEAWLVRADSAGPLRIGMTLAQVNNALNEQFVAPADKSQADCYYLSPTKPPKVFLMFMDGRLARIDVREPGIKTASGIQVGNMEAKVKKAYGARVKVGPHKHVKNGHYLTVMQSDGRRGIRFETTDGKITSYYAGRDQAIQLLEGCQ